MVYTLSLTDITKTHLSIPRSLHFSGLVSLAFTTKSIFLSEIEYKDGNS